MLVFVCVYTLYKKHTSVLLLLYICSLRSKSTPNSQRLRLSWKSETRHIGTTQNLSRPTAILRRFMAVLIAAWWGKKQKGTQAGQWVYLCFFVNSFQKYQGIHSVKLTVRHGKSTILMVFTRKDWIFMGYVSFREGSCFKHVFSFLFLYRLYLKMRNWTHTSCNPLIRTGGKPQKIVVLNSMFFTSLAMIW